MRPASPNSYHEIAHVRIKNADRSISPNINRDRSIHSSNSGEFTVHPGPNLTHSPLGHTGSDLPVDHYIVPVYPNYVTEYEDAFQWPHNGNESAPQISNSSSNLPAAKDPLQLTVPISNEIKNKPIKPISLNEILNISDNDIESNPWVTTEKSLLGLLLKGHEKTLSSGILNKNHLLDDGIEYAYQHLLTRLSLNLSSLQLSPSELEEEKQVREIISIFVKSIRRIKQL